MKFKEKKTINIVLESLFNTYSLRVPDVKKITKAMVSNNIVSDQSEIINDHIAFRTMGVDNLGINSFEKIFLNHGYKKRDFYSFEQKKLNAFWYSHHEKNMPRIFISELKVNELSKNAQKIIQQYTNQVKKQGIENKFIGKNFVFDQRKAERISKHIISKCHQCGEKSDSHTNCANEACHLLFIQCERCAKKMKNCCSNECIKIISLSDQERKELRKGKKNSNKIFKKGRSPVLKFKQQL